MRRTLAFLAVSIALTTTLRATSAQAAPQAPQAYTVYLPVVGRLSPIPIWCDNHGCLTSPVICEDGECFLLVCFGDVCERVPLANRTQVR